MCADASDSVSLLSRLPQNPLMLSRADYRVRLFYVKLHSDCYRRLSSNLAREVCLYLGLHVLTASLTDWRAVLLFDLETGQQSEVSVPCEFFRWSRCCLLSEVRLLAVACDRTFRQTLSINLLDCNIVREARTKEARLWAGVVKAGECVYAFGGDPTALTLSCEKFVQGQWQYFSPMTHRRVCFTPCEYELEIYLPACGPENSPVEVYTPATDAYRALCLCLSAQYYGSVACVVDGELTVVSRAWAVRWGLKSAEKDALWDRHTFTREDSSTPASVSVVIGRKLYWVGADFKLVKFDLSTLSEI